MKYPCRNFHTLTDTVSLAIIQKMSFFGAASSSTTANTAAAADKDIEVADPPTDSISSLSFSSQADYLAVASWDNNVGFTLLD